VGRRYDSPVRQQGVAERRERIVAAGAELAHELSSWDWRELTFRAVAERAGVGERTVYRHFPSERQLHDAVMQRLNEEAGVDYEGIELDTLPEVTGRILRALSGFSARSLVDGPDDPTFHAVDERRRAALLHAVSKEAPAWTPGQRETVAAVLDVLWNVPSHERLVTAWGMPGQRSVDTIAWAIGLVVKAVREGRPPPH
jgi:AcrR family transcriptional regulator